MILGISHDLGGMGVCDELTVVVVDVLLAGDQLAAAAEDGHLLRVSMSPGVLAHFTSLRHW